MRTAAALSLLFAACAGAPLDRETGPATFEDFVGDWRGTMRIAGGPEVRMSLEVAPVAQPAARTEEGGAQLPVEAGQL